MTWKKYIIGVLIALICPYSLGATLYVFVPTETRATVLQEMVVSACGGLEIKVFGRAKDFNQQIATVPPSAILTLLPVIERNNTFSTVLKGSRNGATEEDYMLVSKDTATSLASLTGKKVGVVDVMGRKPMTQFVSQLLQADVKLKRVSKIEDLLPLLSFGAVDSIFVPESIYQILKQKSNINLVATRLNIQLGLVSAALNDSKTESEITKCIGSFSQDINAAMGVDQWKTL